MSKIIIKTKNVKTEKPKAARKAKTGPAFNPIANAMRATNGNQNAALLLLRMHHWMQYARVVKLGEKWMVNPAAWWAAEAGLSPDQYKAAKKVLEASGMIVSKQLPHGKLNITHVRTTAKAQIAMARSADPIGVIPNASAIKLTTPSDDTAKKPWAELMAETDAKDDARSTH